MAEKKTTISIKCTPTERDAIENRQQIRGFDSIAAYTRHLLALGQLAEEAILGRPLTPEAFANAFFAVASAILGREASDALAADALEKIKEWKPLAVEAQQPIVGKIARPIPGKKS